MKSDVGKIMIITALVMMLWGGLSAQDASEGLRLFVQDGQLISHPMRVFVTHEVTGDMEPRLNLNGSTSRIVSQMDGYVGIAPLAIATNQTQTEEIEGQKMLFSGTMLLFDVSGVNMPIYQAMKRVSPVLTWTDRDGKYEKEAAAITLAPLYLGNLRAAILWAAVLIVLVTIFVWGACRLSDHRMVEIISGVGNYLSLSRIQVVAWTIVIGGMVTVFGLMRLEVPSIPESLVVLMGMSLATGGISYVLTTKQEKTKSQTTSTSESPARAKTWRFIDIITEFDAHGNVVGLSLVRTQMLFWTVLLIALFVVKSLFDGELWPVPWEMVVLMGFSQGAYLSPRALLPSKTVAKKLSPSS